MSFRVPLTVFFVLIVVVPIVAIGVLMFHLINDSEHGRQMPVPAAWRLRPGSVTGVRRPRRATMPKRLRGLLGP